MTDPITLSAATIATLIATKAFEKTGEQLSDKVWGLVGNFVTSLKRKDPQFSNGDRKSCRTTSFS